MNKNAQRRHRAVRSRAKIRELRVLRLSVHRTPQHIYAQIFDRDSKVLAAASTLQKSVREGLKATGNSDAAAAVGKAIAEKAKAAGIKQVAFDRSGFKYHGRIKALAEAARANGLEF
jgi:large subunit ribosomal protein L18